MLAHEGGKFLQHFLRFDMLGKDLSKKIFQGVVTHIYKTNKSAVYCMASHHFIKGRWVNV